MRPDEVAARSGGDHLDDRGAIGAARKRNHSSRWQTSEDTPHCLQTGPWHVYVNQGNIGPMQVGEFKGLIAIFRGAHER
jgi:hypothetical protein